MSRLKTVLKDRSGQGTPMILAVHMLELNKLESLIEELL